MSDTSPWIQLLALVALILAIGVITGLATRDTDQRRPQPG